MPETRARVKEERVQAVRSSPPSTAADRLERFLYILPAASREGGVAVEELASELGISREALQDDLTQVTDRAFYHPAGSGSDVQIHLTGDRVSIWTKGEFRRPVSLSLHEAVCVGMALRGELRSGVQELRQELESRIVAAGAQALMDQFEATDLRGGPGGVRRCMAGALQERTVVDLRYLKPGDDAPLDRPVRPYALAHAEGQWYLLAWCEVSEGVRIFRMDRILEARPLGRTFQLPADFDAGAYIQGGRVFLGGEETAVRVRYAPKIARWIAERETGEWDPEGGFTVTHQVVDPHWLVRHVLQYGPDAEVLEPEEARGWVGGVVKPMGVE